MQHTIITLPNGKYSVTENNIVQVYKINGEEYSEFDMVRLHNNGIIEAKLEYPGESYLFLPNTNEAWVVEIPGIEGAVYGFYSVRVFENGIVCIRYKGDGKCYLFLPNTNKALGLQRLYGEELIYGFYMVIAHQEGTLIDICWSETSNHTRFIF